MPSDLIYFCKMKTLNTTNTTAIRHIHRQWQTCIAAYLQLGKFPLSLSVALSALVGYALFRHILTAESLMLFAGILLLSMGSSALNQIQEKDIDARMLRTAGRPLPSGRLQNSYAVCFALLSLLAGLLLIAQIPIHRPANLILAGIAVLWYNGLYTPLKRLSPFAVAPGAIVGAIPPAIGYSAAGGHLLEPPLMLLVLFMILWQIPHFWLLQIRCREDYRRAGLNSICDTFSTTQINRILRIWVICNAISLIILGIFFTQLLLIFALFLLVLAINPQGFFPQSRNPNNLFFLVHLLSGQLTLLCLLIDTLI